MKKITKYFCLFVLLFVVITAYKNYEYHNGIKNSDILFTQIQSDFVNSCYDSYEQEVAITEKNKELNDNAATNYVKPLEEEKDPNNLEVPIFTSGLEAYIFAENVLTKANGFHIEVSGNVETSIGVSQKVKNVRKSDNLGNLYSLSVTYSTFMKSGFEIYYNTRQLKTRNTSLVTSSLSCSFNNNWTFSSLASHKQTYGVLPNELNYIVTQDTVLSEENFNYENGLYTFVLNLNPTTAIENYKKNIKAMSGAATYPNFESIKLTVTIDQNAKFKTINYNETYQITAMGVTTLTNTNLTETFYTIDGPVFLEVPSGF